MKHIPDKVLQKTILNHQPVPSNFIKKQKLDDYLLEILSEWGKKDEIFWEGSLMKSQVNLIKVMRPLGRIWEYINKVKQDPEGVIDIDHVHSLIV